MISILNKYRKNYSYIILASYLFLIALTVFHYHHVDIQNGNSKIENNNGSQNDPFDKIIDLTHECTIQQFANTVINYDFTGVFNLINIKTAQSFSFDKILRLTARPIYNSNPHRAPPYSL